MIERHDKHYDGIWSRLAETMDPSKIQWRQDGKVIGRDGKFFARFVCYVEANDVRERLDSVIPGEWDLTLELLPPLPMATENEEASCSFKARLQILGVIREDVGTGRDYKAAATDAFKRAAVRFGIAHELYSYEQNWCQMDGDGRNAKPLEDPGVVYVRRYGPANGANLRAEDGGKQATPRPTPRAETKSTSANTGAENSSSRTTASAASREPDEETTHAEDGAAVPSCPKCGGRMWDNRLSKRNPKAPDFKCRDKSCDGVVWPPDGNRNGRKPAAKKASSRDDEPPPPDDEDFVAVQDRASDDDDDLPF